MSVIFELGHPKHFFQFEPLIAALRSEYRVRVYAREKDRLFDVLTERGVDFERSGRRLSGLLGGVLASPLELLRFVRFAARARPAVLVSKASPYSAAAARVLGARHVIFPDSEVVALTNRIVAPLADCIVTPEGFGLDWGARHVRVGGIFEGGYLHPAYFQPRPESLAGAGLNAGERYTVVRFVAWRANHDVGNHGFSEGEKVDLVRALAPFGKVVVSAEGPLPPELEPLRFRAAASDMHSILHFASLFVGDSQTMAAEAALLGTPAVRYNSFVGENDMTNFKLLEGKYDALVNVRTAAEATAAAVRLIADPLAKPSWGAKRKRIFAEMPNVNAECLRAIRHSLQLAAAAGR